MNSVQEEQDTSGSYHINVTLLDNTTNLFIKPEIWIASELKRLTKDQHPRNCINHESLLFVLENVDVFNNISPLAYKNDGVQRIPLVSKLKTTKKRDFNTHFDHEMASTTVNKGHLTQKNLIYSYVKLITYCHRGSPQYYLHQHRRPIELLLELEKLNDLIENDSYGDDINRIKENLARIVFGKKIPISRSLVSAWSVICLWVQQGISPVNSRKTLENDEWVCFGTTAYSVAKRLSGIVN